MIYGYDGDFDNFSTGDFNYSDNGLKTLMMSIMTLPSI